MGFIKKDCGKKIGDIVITTRELDSLSGTFEIGSKVKIIAISERGYDIEDDEGNQMIECGWSL